MYHKLYKLLIISLLCVISHSCGSKKKIVDKREEKIKLDSVASSIKTIDLSKSLKEIRFVPVDISKPIVINQDTIYNTKIIYKDKKVDSLVFIKDTVVVEKEVEIKAKQIDLEKQGFNWKGLNWALFLIIFILAAVLGLRYFPKK